MGYRDARGCHLHIALKPAASTLTPEEAARFAELDAQAESGGRISGAELTEYRLLMAKEKGMPSGKDT